MHILDNNSIFFCISLCFSSLAFQKIIIVVRTIHATSIKKRNIKNVILTTGSFPQLIILIVEIRNINKNIEAQIYIILITFKFELNKSHPRLSEHKHGNGKAQQQQQKHIILLILLNKIITIYI